MIERILYGYLLVLLRRADNRPPEVIMRAPNSAPTWMTMRDIERQIDQLEKEIKVMQVAKAMIEASVVTLDKQVSDGDRHALGMEET